jgi:tRNA(Leu) C34 or U34 (ribose-2'-O)-methylase TrmL
MYTHLMAAEPDIPNMATAIVAVAFLLGCLLLITASLGFFVDYRKAKIRAAQEGDLRQLVHRYEQLAEKTMDAQQRAAADVAELRSRTASIEQILRTVE